MQKQWRIIWSLTGMASLCWAGGSAMGQADEAPQYPQYVQYPQGAPPVAPGTQAVLTPDQIDQLLGPIALYPDPLLALIFPAATYPQDVLAAEQWLASTPNPTEAAIAQQTWDDSIKGLVHYPSVLKMMSDQIGWTQTLGATFLNGQQDVLDSVQRLRAEAQAANNLQTNQQEQVVEDGSAIRIEPVDPDVIYVPQYDSDLVYNSQYAVSFGVGMPIGLWDDDDFDWNGGYVVFGGGWYGGWRHPAAWDRNPPAWNRHPSGYVAAPRPWARAARGSVPRIAPAIVARLGTGQRRAAAPANRATDNLHGSPTPSPIGRQPAAHSVNNAFDPAVTRAEVQRDDQRASPARVAPRAPAREAPARAAPPAPAPRTEAPAAPRAAAPAQDARRSAPDNAFSGGSAGDTRAQSNRGHASGGRR